MSPLEAAGCLLLRTRPPGIKESLPGECNKMRRVCWARNAAIILVVMASLALAPVGPGKASAKTEVIDRSESRLPRPGPTIPPGRSTTSTTGKCSSSPGADSNSWPAWRPRRNRTLPRSPMRGSFAWRSPTTSSATRRRPPGPWSSGHAVDRDQRAGSSRQDRRRDRPWRF